LIARTWGRPYPNALESEVKHDKFVPEFEPHVIVEVDVPITGFVNEKLAPSTVLAEPP
jgi:hypothetical protein